MNTLAQLFQNWRGSIKFRFQIVASQLHRGRLRIAYDPVEAGVNPPENSVYSRIIDLATNRDFEMVVAWNHPKAWLETLPFTSQSDHLTITPGPEFHNGQIGIYVVNELTSPNPALGQDVYINVYASACEDFELAKPSDIRLRTMEYVPQSGDEDGEELVDEQDGIPESPGDITPVGHIEWTGNQTNHVFFGETVASVRAMLKRYSYLTTWVCSGGAGGHHITEGDFPFEKGRPSNDALWMRNTTSSGATPPSTPYNYGAMTLLNYFVPCYAGWRGGIRSKYYIRSASPNLLYVRRLAQVYSEPEHEDQLFSWNTSNSQVAAYSGLEHHGVFNGSDCTFTYSDGMVEVEHPHYVPYRFTEGRRVTARPQPGGVKSDGYGLGHIFYYAKDTVPNHSSHVDRWVAAADDFSCFFWIGQPAIMNRNTPAASAAARVVPTIT
jgi:hypothetical protein